MLSRPLVLRLLAVFLGVFCPGTGLAWTEAHVREAHVTLALADRDRIDIELDLALEVRGGWLERLELPGLDEGLVLAEQEPALAILESGEHVPAQVSRRSATLILKFVRRDGLRRGLHHLIVRYALPHAASAQHAGHAHGRLYWSLPGFEAGLARATVSVRGPLAMSAVEAPEVAQAVESREQAGQRVLTFSRLHVPRASPWTVAFDVPEQHVAAKRAARDVQEDGARREQSPWALALLVGFSLALVAAMRFRVQRVLRSEGLKARGLWLARPLMWRVLLVLSVLAALSFASLPALAVAAWACMFVLGVPQAALSRGPVALGSFRPLMRVELRALSRARLRDLLGVPWADITTVFGALGALSLLSGFFVCRGLFALNQAPWGWLALCALFGFIASSGSLRPRSFAEQVRRLERAARRARTVGSALSLVAYESKGRLSQPRLRIVPSARYPGLLRLEVLVDTRRSAQPLVLSALVEADSAAERWLLALWPHALREGAEGGRRVALLFAIDDVGKAAEAALEQLSRESQRMLFRAVASAHAA